MCAECPLHRRTTRRSARLTRKSDLEALFERTRLCRDVSHETKLLKACSPLAEWHCYHTRYRCLCPECCCWNVMARGFCQSLCRCCCPPSSLLRPNHQLARVLSPPARR
ncbi:unnamed protein product [Ectocarpus sp. 13 AM-2016]